MDRSIRAVLYRDRLREIVPVIVFWVVFNVLVAAILSGFGVLDERTALLWSLGYFLFDMVCVVLWCPLQLLLMHPERFNERTNARLTCAQCTDKLCHLRKPLAGTLAALEAPEPSETSCEKAG